MKIAIISFRTFEHGGVERYAFELVNALSERAEVHLFTHEASESVRANVHAVPSVGKKDLFSVNSFMAFLKTTIERQEFDIIHSMGPLYLKPDVVTAHICQKRLLTDSKSLFGDFSLLRKSYWAFRSRIAAGFQKKSFENAGMVIAVSSMLGNEIKTEYGIDGVRVMYPGIGREFFDGYAPQRKEHIRQDMKMPQGAFIVLFVGSQWERKGLKHLIEAMKFLDGEVMLIVVGNGNEEKYRSFARKCNVEQRVLFKGFTKKILDYYLAADVLVLPSLYEPFGYPVLEAMAMGLPVIASKQVGAAEMVEEGETGFIIDEIKNTAAISEAIQKIRPKGAAAFAEAARAKAQQFLWDNQVQEILSLYEKLYAEKGNG